MSRLRRSKVRLEKAQHLLDIVTNSAQEHQLLDLPKKLLLLLNDIPITKLFPIHPSEEWSTVMTVLEIAAHGGIIDTEPTNTIDNIPHESVSITEPKYSAALASESLAVIGQCVLGVHKVTV